jgi:hypothetical protein
LNIGPLELSGDWVESLGLPVPGWLLLISAGAAIGAVVAFVAEVQKRGRKALMHEVAARMGMQYTSEAPDASQAASSEVFADGVSLDHHFHGTRDGLPLEIFDLTETSESRDSEGNSRESITRRTVCLLPANGLPEFTLAPRKSGHRLVSMLGLGGMSFDPEELTTPIDRKAVERFTTLWHLAASVPTIATEAADFDGREQQVRNLFTPQLMDSLGTFQEWSVQIRCGRLFVWRGKGFSSAREREALAAAAVQLRTLLLNALQSPSGVTVPAMSGETLQVRARRATGAAVGGGLGGFLGFFGGFAVFLSLEMAREDHFANGSSFVFFFAFPFFGLVLGGLCGALVGSRLGRFVKLTPPAPMAQRQGPGGWVTVGTFFGFILGGLAGAGFMVLVDTLIGLNRVPTWLVFPTFFAFPILGLIGGAIAGSRIQARRARRGEA